MLRKALQKVLNEEIPLTNAIGISVESCDSLSLTLAAPLHKNINHKRTAFGGSLYIPITNRFPTKLHALLDL